MPSRSKQDLNVTLVTAFEQAVREYERLYPEAPQPFLTCTYRSDAEQEALFAKGRTEKGVKVTNARAGQSPHNFKPSFAFDIAFIGLNKKLDWSDKLFKTFSDIIKRTSPSVEWGGDFKNLKDMPHFELKGWKNLAR